MDELFGHDASMRRDPHGEIGWLTPGERFDGTPFTDHGFDPVPALAHLVPWLEELRPAA